MDIEKYCSTKEAASIFGKSRRTTHNILYPLFNSDDGLSAIKILKNGVYQNFYNKDRVLELILSSKQKVRCCIRCRCKFYPKCNERFCVHCRSSSDFTNMSYSKNKEEFDVTTVKAIYLVLTSEYWWRLATKIILIGWIISMLVIFKDVIWKK